MGAVNASNNNSDAEYVPYAFNEGLSVPRDTRHILGACVRHRKIIEGAYTVSASPTLNTRIACQA